MSRPFEWPLADKLVRATPQAPLLSVVIPTFNRPEELVVAVEGFAGQMAGGLEDKVEIILSDNASDRASAVETIRALAERRPNLSYYIHAVNGGGPAQICAAPWRARGRWTWVFGDDDLLAPGGLAHVVRRLETDAPAFLTLNRKVMDKTLTQVIQPAKHSAPDFACDSFVELVRGIGVDQLTFYSSQVYLTEAARAIDPTPYASSPSHYCHVAYYLAAYHDRSAFYDASTYVLHRWDPGAVNTHHSNFYHLGATFPAIMATARDLSALPKDLFERISGEKRVSDPAALRISFVDMVLQNLWRCVASGWPITEAEWAFLDGECANWRPHRRAQFDTVRALAASLDVGMAKLEALAGAPAASGDAALDPVALREGAQFLGDQIIQGRAAAHQMAHQFE